MSLHFHAYQFNQPFEPKKLCNWEIPRRFPKKPQTRVGHTQIIANDRGHLLPGIPRPQSIGSGPWGHFIPTWKMPKRITKDIATCLRDPKPKNLDFLQSEKSKELKEPVHTAEKQVIKLPERDISDEDPCANIPNKTEEPLQQNEAKDLSYIPGDLTEPKHRPSSYELLRPQPKLTLEDLHSPEMSSKDHSIEKYHQTPKINPFACVYRNFELAKRCKKENLEHQALPDTITDKMYRKLQMERMENPGLGLNEETYATGIGWKGASGPTQCTKFKVYRPKTCANKTIKNVEQRPGSCGSFDLKWRFIKQKNVTPIELAICWDMTPENPNQEPKRTTHIDGSNGSAAPAVFAMVQSPKQAEISAKKSCDNGCQTSKSNSARSSQRLHSSESKEINSISTNSLYVNLPQTRKFSSENYNNLCKSLPNLSDCNCSNKNCPTKKYSKFCEACNQKLIKPNTDLPKSDYKLAFKAGKLHENKSVDSTVSSSAGTKIKVPKQKDPYARRNYSIDSLHPPFSVWKGASCQSYPEHWRLASIYQHSYKPVENRKKSLLASVYQ